MFSRTRVLGPRLTMFCLAFLLANCGPEESADTLHCIDNYVINAKLGETPIVPNLCSGATTALEQLWTDKYDVIFKTTPGNAQVVSTPSAGGSQYSIKQKMDLEETQKFTLTVSKPGSKCKDLLGETVVCSTEVEFSVVFAKDGGLSVTIDGTPPSGIVPSTMPMVTLKAMPTGATAPTYKWERTKLIQSGRAVFEMVGTADEVTAAGLGDEPYFYRVVVTDSGRDANAATVLRPQAFGVSLELPSFSSYPGTSFSVKAVAAETASFEMVMQQPSECDGRSVRAEDYSTIAASPDRQLNCTWVTIATKASTMPVAANSPYVEASSELKVDHEGVYRVLVTVTSAGKTVRTDRSFFRAY